MELWRSSGDPTVTALRLNGEYVPGPGGVGGWSAADVMRTVCRRLGRTVMPRRRLMEPFAQH